MADSKAAGLKKAVFTTVDKLRPGTSGHNLTIKVVDSKLIMQRPGNGRSMRIAECLVGDETGMIVFSAKNDQVDLMKAGTILTVHNAKIDMFKGSMRLAVDRWGRMVQATEDQADIKVKEDNNLSLIEFELIKIVEDQEKVTNTNTNTNANNNNNISANGNSESK